MILPDVPHRAGAQGRGREGAKGSVPTPKVPRPLDGRGDLPPEIPLPAAAPLNWRALWRATSN